MELKQTQKLSQILALTPQMRESLYILQLPLMELKNYLEAKLEDNPVLESKELKNAELPMDVSIEKIMDISPPYSQYLYSGYSSEEVKKKLAYKESIITKETTMGEYLLKQLHIIPLRKEKYRIGEFIIGNIDSNGYLNMSVGEIRENLREKGIKATKKEVEEVIGLLHNFDPPGIGARNLKECLLIQLKLKKKQNILAKKIVENYLSYLAQGRIKTITKKLHTSLTEIKKAIKEIMALEPKPGRMFSTHIIEENKAPVIPDVIVEKIENKYEIIINSRLLPELKISSYYLNLLKSDDISPNVKKYIQKKINAALHLIKAISQREKTILKIAEHIVKFQKDFFEQGDISSLKPLTMKEVARIIKRNESTVSRVVNRKYMQTPYGIFGFDFFFTKALKDNNLSQEFIKSKIQGIIEEENPNSPYKDSEIAKILKKEGVCIARRTIAKYREELKIPPYHKRKI